MSVTTKVILRNHRNCFRKGMSPNRM